MTIGIYKLNFSGTEKCYIGQSKNIEYRFREHIYNITNNLCSKKLYEAYITYGLPISYDILCECSVSELDSLENEMIEIFSAHTDGFNSNKREGGAIRGVGGINHWNSKYSKFTILRIFSLLYSTNITYQEIANKCNVNKYLVHNIVSGIHHLWLTDEYPQEFQLMLAKKLERNKTNLKTYSAIGSTHKPLISPTGEIFENISNIAKFCRTHPLLKDGCSSTRSSIGKVLKGTKKSHKGWHLQN